MGRVELCFYSLHSLSKPWGVWSATLIVQALPFLYFQPAQGFLRCTVHEVHTKLAWAAIIGKMRSQDLDPVIEITLSHRVHIVRLQEKLRR
jgi:hypothetical protein